MSNGTTTSNSSQSVENNNSEGIVITNGPDEVMESISDDEEETAEVENADQKESVDQEESVDREEPVEQEENVDREEPVEQEENVDREEPVEQEENVDREEPVEQEENVDREEPVEQEENSNVEQKNKGSADSNQDNGVTEPMDSEPETEPETGKDAPDQDQEEPQPESEPEVSEEVEEDEQETTAGEEDSEAGGGKKEESRVDILYHDVNAAPREFNAIVELDEIKNLIGKAKVLVEECKIRISPEGLSIRAVDPANVGMVDAVLEKEGFEKLEATKGTLGVNLGRLQDVMGMGNTGDLVHMNFDTKRRKLVINIDGMEYTLATIDPDSIRQEPDIPNLDLPGRVVIESDQISRGVTACDMVSDHITLKTESDPRNNRFIMEAEGDTDDVDLEKKENEKEVTEITTSNEGTDSLFSLEYIKDINKAIPKSTDVTVDLGTEFPVKFHHEDSGGLIKTTYMLAPRIQSD